MNNNILGKVFGMIWDAFMALELYIKIAIILAFLITFFG